MKVSTLSRLRSDHYPLLLEANFSNHVHTSSFKFFSMWTLPDNAKDLITKCWSDTIVSCLMCLLSRKLQLLKCSLKTRNKDIFENIHVMVRNSTDKVSAIQDQISLDGSSPHLRAKELLAQQDQS